MWKQLFQRDNLLVCFVSTIIHHNVEFGNLLFEGTPKLSIGLVTYKYSRRVIFIDLTVLFDVNSIYVTIFSKILLPHEQAATAIHPYFKNMNFPVYELLKISMINIEIMIPFPNARAAHQIVEMLP